MKAAPDTRDGEALARRVQKPDCLYAAPADAVLLRHDSGALRGLLFREVYLDRTRPVRKAASIAEALGATPPPPNEKGNYAATQRFSDCVVSADPTAAEALIRAPIGTPEQDAAVSRVATKMAGCLQKDMTLQMSRLALESALSEALYRRASNPVQEVTSVAEADTK